MAASRATQFNALRSLARGSQQVRNLHMTGPATYASPVLTTERPILNLPGSVVGLRAECQLRGIDKSGSKKDLIDRIHADELAHTRAFSTRRPAIPQVPESNKSNTRHFNTSRELKAVNDSSTIDFAFMPDVLAPENVDVWSQVRVPILPSMAIGTTRQNVPIDPEPSVMKPTISPTSADTIVLPMTEMTDGHAMGVDFHAMADRVATNLRKMSVPVEEQASMVKQIFTDIMDDIANIQKTTART